MSDAESPRSLVLSPARSPVGSPAGSVITQRTQMMTETTTSNSSLQASIRADEERQRQVEETTQAQLSALQAELGQYRQTMAIMAARLEKQGEAIEVTYASAKESHDHAQERLENVESAVQRSRAASEARWGSFSQPGRGDHEDEEMETTGETAKTQGNRMMIATGANMPTAPMYKGTSQREKREFMDAYLLYERKVKLLNASTGTQVYRMPVGGCVDHKTLVRISKYELRKAAADITEEEWINYFWKAHERDRVDVPKIKAKMRGLKMKMDHPDAASRVVGLMSDFEMMLDELDVEPLTLEEPKMCVNFLIAALEPKVFRDTIRADMQLTSKKHLLKNVPDFVAWLQDQLRQFLRFETELVKNQPELKSVPARRSTEQNQRRGRQGVTSKDEKRIIVSKSAEKMSRECFKCGSTDHGVYSCPDATEAEARALWNEQKQKRKARPPVGAVHLPKMRGEAPTKVLLTGWLDSGEAVEVLTDYGASESVICPNTVRRLTESQSRFTVKNLQPPVKAVSFTGETVEINKWILLDLRFETPGGPLQLRNLGCWVSPDPLPSGLGSILLSSRVMGQLGYSPQALLEQAQSVSPVFDMASSPSEEKVATIGFVGLAASQTAEEESKWQPLEKLVCFPSLHEKDSDRKKVEEVLMKGVETAKACGLSDTGTEILRNLLLEFEDSFRVELGHDPPVDVAPLIVKLKPDAEPVRAKSRRYPQEHREFMRRHVEDLRAANLVYRNPRSAWCSPPLVVKKPQPGEFRMTVDVRAVNAQTQRQVWPMPQLEVIFEHLRGARAMASLDFFKGYWQFPLAVESQEMFSFLTDEGVFTPTRVLMGGSDSVAYCQSTVQDILESVLYKSLLIWLDDLLVYHASEEGLLAALRNVLEICKERGLKLNPKKCDFFQNEALWCGKIVSGNGVRHDPGRLEALRALPTPETGADLVQFVCAVNWMRGSMPAHNAVTKPLRDFLEKVYEKAGSRKKRQVAKVRLVDVGWSRQEADSLQKTKEALEQMVVLSHPDPEKILCVFSDASQYHWGAVITQVSADVVARPLEEQDHEPLLFLSGTFSGAAQSWAIVEKEAFSIVETCKRADYLLHRSGGFRLFTDHRNLRYIFDPHSVKTAVPKYTADKLQRWALLLMGYDYVIYDIAGETNVWADLLSRWGAPRASICAIRLEEMPISHEEIDSTKWPSMGEVVKTQESALRVHFQPPECLTPRKGDDSIWRVKLRSDTSSSSPEVIWIPSEASELQLRLLVVAHFGLAGHVTAMRTKDSLAECFYWDDMEKDCVNFVKRCLHCAAEGHASISRPLGEALHATKPNEILHWDFLHMGKGNSSHGHNYVLVMKDDASHYVWLKPYESADAESTFEALMDWFSSFGVCYQWVTDQGTHFKNEVIQALQHALGAHHHFTAARAPWSNGTVEVVNRDLLKLMRVLLSQYRMATADWFKMLPLVQLILNQRPSPTLGNLKPIQVMTGLNPVSETERIAIPTEPVSSAKLATILAEKRTEFEALSTALEKLHKQAAAARKRKQSAGRKSGSRRAQMAQFEVGDYVLYADVWTHPPNKLKLQWNGPATVVEAVSSWIFKIRHLVTHDEREVHASRLKFYADKDFRLSETLLAHVAHNSEGHVVENLLEARYNAQLKGHEILVKWRGMDATESSWEPAVNLLQDVPAVLKKFVKENPDNNQVSSLAADLKLATLSFAVLEGGVVPAPPTPDTGTGAPLPAVKARRQATPKKPVKKKKKSRS